MHMNKVIVVGRIGERGVKVTYSEQAVPTCSLWLEVDEVGKDGRTFTAYVPVEIVGRQVEDLAQSLEPGDEVMVEGRLKYRTSADKKTGQKTGRLVISTWTVIRAAERELQALTGDRER